MSRFGFLKKKWFWFTAIPVLLIGWFIFGRGGSEAVAYETAPVERTAIKQTVEVTGQVAPAARIELSFATNGRVQDLKVRAGDKVKKGDVLAQLEADDVTFAVRRAEASLLLAQANLDLKLAGDTKESIQVSQASVDQAKANYNKALSDLTTTEQTVEDNYRLSVIDFDTAKKNLENSGATYDQTAQNGYDSLRNSLRTALGAMQAGLSDGDAIIGIDNPVANDNYEAMIGISDSASLQRAKNAWPIAKEAKAAAEKASLALTASSAFTDIRVAADLMTDALTKTQVYLDEVQRTLTGTITNAYLTATELTTKRATIEADRAAVSTQLANVVTAKQTAITGELNRTTSSVQLQNAFESASAKLSIAEADRTNKVVAAKTNVEIQKAALDSAQASLALKKAKPRDVDLNGYRAQLLDAQVAYDQAMDRLMDVQIIAPVDGTITDVLPAKGEQTGANVTAVTMIGTEAYDVEALVPEADIAKVKVGQSAEMTLDAFGDDVKFMGTVVAENPDQTKVQDAIYYKVYVTINLDEKDVKPGMTANVTVLTGARDQTLVIPLRAVRTQEDGSRKTVRILEGNKPKEIQVELGLRGDEGRVEVLKGLDEGQQVITGETVGGKPKS